MTWPRWWIALGCAPFFLIGEAMWITGTPPSRIAPEFFARLAEFAVRADAYWRGLGW